MCKDYEIQCKHLSLVLLLKPIYSQLPPKMIFKPSSVVSEIVATYKLKLLRIGSSHRFLISKCKYLLILKQNKAKLTPTPNDVPKFHIQVPQICFPRH